MSSKTKNKRNSPSIIKNGTAISIVSGCDKPFIADHLTDYRDKYNRIQTEYDKAIVKLEQMGQLRKDNDDKLRKLTEKNKIITDLQTIIAQRDNEIKTLKDTSVHRNEVNVLEGKIKKKEHTIKELEKQIDSTKINAVASLENQIVKLKAENKKLKEELKKDNTQSRFDMIRVLSDDIKKVSDENIQLKKDNETLKQEHGELIQKLDKIQNAITLLYDDF